MDYRLTRAPSLVPLGIKALAVVSLLGAVESCVVGVMAVWSSRDLSWGAVVYCFVSALVSLFIGVGLLLLRKSAWYGQIVLMGIGVVSLVTRLIRRILPELMGRGPQTVEPSTRHILSVIVLVFVSLLWIGAIIYYMTRPRIRLLFGVGQPLAKPDFYRPIG